MRRALRHLFERTSSFVVLGEADSAEAALERLLGLQVDLCLVDLSLPGMSGLELIRRLRKEQPNLRCLVVTGYGDAMYQTAALAAGAAGYVTKGDPEMVLSAVHEATI